MRYNLLQAYDRFWRNFLSVFLIVLVLGRILWTGDVVRLVPYTQQHSTEEN